MNYDKKMNYDEKIESIKRIDFSIWDNYVEMNNTKQTNLDNSYGIEIPDLYDGMEPKRSGIFDTRLGIMSSSLECPACGLVKCIGHTGHKSSTETQPMNFTIDKSKIKYVKDILDLICLDSKELLLDKKTDYLTSEQITKLRQRRLNMIQNIKNEEVDKDIIIEICI